MHGALGALGDAHSTDHSYQSHFPTSSGSPTTFPSPVSREILGLASNTTLVDGHNVDLSYKHHHGRDSRASSLSSLSNLSSLSQSSLSSTLSNDSLFHAPSFSSPLSRTPSPIISSSPELATLVNGSRLQHQYSQEETRPAEQHAHHAHHRSLRDPHHHSTHSHHSYSSPDDQEHHHCSNHSLHLTPSPYDQEHHYYFNHSHHSHLSPYNQEHHADSNNSHYSHISSFNQEYLSNYSHYSNDQEVPTTQETHHETSDQEGSIANLEERDHRDDHGIGNRPAGKWKSQVESDLGSTARWHVHVDLGSSSSNSNFDSDVPSGNTSLHRPFIHPYTSTYSVQLGDASPAHNASALIESVAQGALRNTTRGPKRPSKDSDYSVPLKTAAHGSNGEALNATVDTNRSVESPDVLRVNDKRGVSESIIHDAKGAESPKYASFNNVSKGAESSSIDNVSKQAVSPSIDNVSLGVKSPSIDNVSKKAESPSLDIKGGAFPSTDIKGAAFPSIDNVSLGVKSPSIDNVSKRAESPSIDIKGAASPSIDNVSKEAESLSIDNVSKREESPSIDNVFKGAESLSIDNVSRGAESPNIYNVSLGAESLSIDSVAHDSKVTESPDVAHGPVNSSVNLSKAAVNTINTNSVSPALLGHDLFSEAAPLNSSVGANVHTPDISSLHILNNDSDHGANATLYRDPGNSPSKPLRVCSCAGGIVKRNTVDLLTKKRDDGPPTTTHSCSCANSYSISA